MANFYKPAKLYFVVIASPKGAAISGYLSLLSLFRAKYFQREHTTKTMRLLRPLLERGLAMTGEESRSSQ
jgi:hypothetical protein